MLNTITLMVLAGSALMIHNIVRYGNFMLENRDMDRDGRSRGMLTVPMVLLVFFLFAYLIVALSRAATLLIAAILLGGSVFVFLLLSILLSFIGRLQDTDRLLAARYDAMKAELDALIKDSSSALLVDLTRDEVLERAGDRLYESDLENDTYSGLLAAREQHVISRGRDGVDASLFRREGLLQHYQEGHTSASEVLLVRCSDGLPAFVKFDANLSKMPVTGDVTALITERLYNDEVVQQTLLEHVLMHHYDRIAYLIDGRCHTMVSNAGKRPGLLLTSDDDDTYESIYYNDILPAQVKGADHTPGRVNPLRLSVIDKALAGQDSYEVNDRFLIDGEVRSKRFIFYCIDRAAKFYLMLLSDSVQTRAADAPAEGSVPAEAAAPAPEEAPAPEPSAPAGPALHVLLVDDNEINREIAELMLTAEGFTVDTAVDGGQAVERVSASAPGDYDVVLMDVQMPVLNGYEATAKIRALPDPALAAIPIIALTANAYQEDINAALAAGMNGHVVKPIVPEALRSAIDQALDRKEG